METLVTFQRGFDITKKDQESGPYPVISSSGSASTHAEFKVIGPGVVVGRKGTLGTVFFSEGAFWPHDTTLWVKDFHGNHPKFCYYFLRTMAFERFDCGASNPTLNRNHIHQLTISYPPPELQQRIAAILSAYDNLIDNNARRIKILEEMVQSLYQEWFIDLRFPGHEKSRITMADLGRVPNGWLVKPLGEIATITMGLSPKGETYNEQGQGSPLINGPVEFGERFAKAVKWTTAPTKFCKEGDLIVCVRGSTGRYVKSDGVYCLGRGVCGLSSEFQSFVDLLFRNELPKLLAKTGGSTFSSWTGPQLKSHACLCPPFELLERFEAMVRPMTAAVALYSRKSQNLRATRDFLLLKLISGEVSVDAVTEAAELMEQPA